MQNLIWGAAQPFTGALADKYGSKIVVAVGGCVVYHWFAAHGSQLYGLVTST